MRRWFVFLFVLSLFFCFSTVSSVEAAPTTSVATSVSQVGELGVVRQASSSCKYPNCEGLFSAFSFIYAVGAGMIGVISTVGLSLVDSALPTRVWGGILLFSGISLVLTSIVPLASAPAILKDADPFMANLPWISIGTLLVGAAMITYGSIRIHRVHSRKDFSKVPSKKAQSNTATPNTTASKHPFIRPLRVSSIEILP